MKTIALLFGVLALCACQTQQTVNRLGATQAVLVKGSSIYLAIPQRPGRDDEREYPNSDYQTAETCASAFGQYARVKLGRDPENIEKALASARNGKCDYLVKPEIRAWEDNPTEWNGERDIVEIDVETFEVSTGRSISRVILRGKSKWLTAGAKPEAMLIGFFEPHAAELFAVPK